MNAANMSLAERDTPMNPVERGGDLLQVGRVAPVLEKQRLALGLADLGMIEIDVDDGRLPQAHHRPGLPGSRSEKGRARRPTEGSARSSRRLRDRDFRRSQNPAWRPTGSCRRPVPCGRRSDIRAAARGTRSERRPHCRTLSPNRGPRCVITRRSLCSTLFSKTCRAMECSWKPARSITSQEKGRWITAAFLRSGTPHGALLGLVARSRRVTSSRIFEAPHSCPRLDSGIAPGTSAPSRPTPSPIAAHDSGDGLTS